MMFQVECDGGHEEVLKLKYTNCMGFVMYLPSHDVPVNISSWS